VALAAVAILLGEAGCAMRAVMRIRSENQISILSVTIAGGEIAGEPAGKGMDRLCQRASRAAFDREWRG
jgi:hypothetical protein